MDSVEEVNNDGAEDREIETVQQSVGEKYVITAYCACMQCCGKNDGITASGAQAVEGVTVAMDKSMPFGTKIYIDGIGERIVQDRGGAIRGNRIDLYFSSHSEALAWGVRYMEVLVEK